MFRALFPLLCGCVVALVIGVGATAEADQRGLADSLSSQTTSETSARTCYYACDEWTLYPTYEACFENCVDPCDRVCF